MAELLPEKGLGLAVNDRLRRAATYPDYLLFLRTKIMSMRYLRHAGLLVITLTISVLSFAQAEKYQGTMFENMAPASFEWAANRLATL